MSKFRHPIASFFVVDRGLATTLLAVAPLNTFPLCSPQGPSQKTLRKKLINQSHFFISLRPTNKFDCRSDIKKKMSKFDISLLRFFCSG